MAESIAPAFVKIEYTSSNAPHVMILPTLEWTSTGFGLPGEFAEHSGGSTPGDTMVELLVGQMVAMFTSSMEFVNYTIFTQASPSADPVPVFSAPLGVAGSTVSTTWQKAVQITCTSRTTLGGIAKLTFLDAISYDNWDRIVDLAAFAQLDDVFALWSDELFGWSGRDGGRPATFLQATKTLNEKLRRQYHMT